MRKFLIAILAVLMLSLGGAALAQDDTMDFCGGLSEADCALYNGSAAAMAEVTSATFSFAFDLSIADTGEGDGTITLTGGGAYALGDLDASVMDALNNPNASPEEALAALGGALTAFDGDLSLSVGLPADPSIPFSSIDLNLLLVDGVGYLDFAGLGTLLGGPEVLEMLGLPTEWAGLDLVDTVEQLGALGGDALDMDSMGGAMSEDDAMAMVSAVEPYITITRLDDEGGMAVFETDIDLAGLLADENLMDVIQAQAALTGTPLSDEDLAQAAMLFEMLGDGFDFSLTQKIDLATNYSTSLAFNFLLDASALGETGTISMTGSFDFADFNAAPAITAPEGAPVATFMDVIMLLGTFGGEF